MKNLHALDSAVSEGAAADTHKKFKRKAREPRRLFHSPDRAERAQDPTLSLMEIPHWPTAISQPLCSRLRLAPRPPLTSTHQVPRPPLNNTHQAPQPPLTNTHQAPRPPLTNTHQELSHQPLSKTLFRPHYEEEHRSPSPKMEYVQRLRPPTEGGHVPEVKALQQTRRLLANARERTRVHTISAAFEALRKQVPCYSYGQKLSKLAILRIACNYILSLAQLAELDYGSEQNKRSFSHCVEQCTRTLQAEGRSKKKKMERGLDSL